MGRKPIGGIIPNSKLIPLGSQNLGLSGSILVRSTFNNHCELFVVITR